MPITTHATTEPITHPTCRFATRSTLAITVVVAALAAGCGIIDEEAFSDRMKPSSSTTEDSTSRQTWADPTTDPELEAKLPPGPYKAMPASLPAQLEGWYLASSPSPSVKTYAPYGLSGEQYEIFVTQWPVDVLSVGPTTIDTHTACETDGQPDRRCFVIFDDGHYQLDRGDAVTIEQGLALGNALYALAS